MKKVVMLVVSLISLLMLSGCDDVNSYKHQKSMCMSDQDAANRAVAYLFYFKDPRTGLCFAKYDRCIVLVPEEKIPKEMLFIADISK